MYNALAQSRTEVVSLPVETNSPYEVEELQSGMVWSVVESTLFPNHNYTQSNGASQFVVHFKASNLPPLGASVFRLRRPEGDLTATPAISRRLIGSETALHQPELTHQEDDLTVSNGILSVAFDR